MSKMKISAGILMYRIKGGSPEVLLVHPGGPFYAKKDDGVWSIPKGEADSGKDGEQLLDVAKREFAEETSFKIQGHFTFLGTVERKSYKIVHTWALEGDCDPAQIKSNIIFIDWPPRTGKKMKIPEVDRGAFFALEEAKKKISPYQVGTIEAFEKLILKS
ncbi:MAG: NUDIX domain-containing protein [Candidatus Pacebacteria bacterium]|nr:NUDIX domain-containing protein [Candidatus Paceibacterota bacterium]